MKVFLVDDHPLYRLGVRSGLQKQPHIKIIGEAPLHPDVVREIEGSSADVVLIGVPEHPMPAVDLLRSIGSHPPARCVVLCRDELDRTTLSMATDSGNFTFVKKAIPLTDLIALLRAEACLT